MSWCNLLLCLLILKTNRNKIKAINSVPVHIYLKKISFGLRANLSPANANVTVSMQLPFPARERSQPREHFLQTMMTVTTQSLF